MIKLTIGEVLHVLYALVLGAAAFGTWKKSLDAGMFVFFIGIGLLLLLVVKK